MARRGKPLLYNGVLKKMDIFDASKAGDVNSLKECVKSGLDVNSRDRDLITPLLWSAYHNHMNAVKYLLSAKADINARGKDGITALMRAVEKNNIDMVKLLLAARANVNIVDNYRERLYQGQSTKSRTPQSRIC
jgi:ankyrin repeat protein